MKLLFSVPWPGQSLYSNKPIQAPSDFAGTKMRAYNPCIDAHCAVAQGAAGDDSVVRAGPGPGDQHGQQLPHLVGQRRNSKLYEQVRYFYTVNAWLPRNATVVNQKAFDALDKPTQEAGDEGRGAAEKRGWETSERSDKEYLKELAAKGMADCRCRLRR